MSESKRVGDVSEVAVTKRLLELGLRVSEPVGEYSYDLVVETEDNLKRVQVKTARERTDRNVIRADFQKNASSESREYYDGSSVDAFAIYYPNKDEVYWLWFGEAPRTGVARSVEKMREDLISEKLK